MNGTRKCRPGIEGAVVAPEALDDAGARLRHDPDRARDGDQDDQPDADADDEGCDLR